MTLLEDALAVRRAAGLPVDDEVIERIRTRIENSVSSEQTDWRHGIKMARAFLAKQPKRVA